jgi:type I restriction enzyme M protein
MVALPGQLFYSTQIPVCLWFLARNKADGKRRSRKSETLFIDARRMGTLIDRVHRELLDEDIAKIVGAYHAWRGDKGAGKYEDIAGFCKGSNLAEIKKHGYILTPGRYVGAEDAAEDDEPFEIRMLRLVGELNAQLQESGKLEQAIKANLKKIGYGE